MLNNISAKNKTMAFVTVLLMAFSAILMWTIYTDQKEKLLAMESSYYDNIKNSYEKVIERHKEFYTNRAKANITSEGIIEAVKNKDRESLMRLSQGRWSTLRRENEYLKVMHFHAADGTSIVRMHKPDMYGDRVADIRPMIAKVHRDKEPLYGFEGGLFYLAYRTIMPIYDGNEYVGALEFGSRPDVILSEMKYYNNLSGALFISNQKLTLYKENRDFNIGDYTLQYSNMIEPRLLRNLKEDGYAFQNFYHIHLYGEAYNIYSLDMKNYEGEIVGKTILVHDMTAMEKNFQHGMKRLGGFLIALLVMLLLVINLGFKKIISTLDKTNKDLNNNRQFLHLILDNTAHAVIATKPDGTITLFNKRAEAMLGYAEEEMVGKTTPLKFHKSEELISRAKAMSIELGREVTPDFDIIKTSAEEETDDEWTYVSRDGYEFPVSLSISPMEDENGEITGYVGISEDICLKKIMESKLIKQKDELEAIFHTSRDGIAIMDLETNFVFFNSSYERLTGYTASELKKLSCLDLTHPDDVETSKEAVAEIYETGFLENFEKRCLRKDGRILNVSMTFVLMPDKKHFLTTTNDITAAKKAEKQLNEYMELLDKHTIASTVDINGDFTYVSQGLSDVSGYSKTELLGKNHRMLRHPDITEEFIQHVLDTIHAGRVWIGELKNITKEGKTYWTDAYLSAILSEEGEIVGYTSISHDITDKKRIEQISVTDGLTGIFNRRHFNDMFPKYVNSAKRQNSLMNFIIFDIDHFKQYNDHYGHQMGDEALIKVAKALQASVQRADDICFRLGGEEFGVLYKTKTVQDAIDIAERIRKDIESTAIPHAHSATADVVTVSVGLICSVAEDIECTDKLYAEADKLLYAAKGRGRNRVEFSTPY